MIRSSMPQVPNANWMLVRCGPAFLTAILLLPAASRAQSRSGVLPIPPAKTVFTVDGTPLELSAWGEISIASRDSVQAVLTADLSDLQRKTTPLLRSQLDRSERCGERLEVQSASLVPSAPAAVLTANVHYERWGCAKVLGKEVVKRLLGGNAMVEVRLMLSSTPEGIALASEVQNVTADGSLGEVLRSGSLGAPLREKIARSVESAVRKGASPQSILPEALKSVMTISSVQFADDGGDRLRVVVRGQAQLTGDQVQLLSKESRSR